MNTKNNKNHNNNIDNSNILSNSFNKTFFFISSCTFHQKNISNFKKGEIISDPFLTKKNSKFKE